MSENLTELCKYFTDFQINYICRKRTINEWNKINIDDLIEKWNKFVTISIDYFKYLLNFYNKKLSDVIEQLISINVLKYDIAKLEETNNLMEKYIIMPQTIEAELEYYVTGTVCEMCEHNTATMETFNNITISNQSLMNRSVDIIKVYELTSKEVKFKATLKSLIRPHDDEIKFSLLSLKGIEFLYYQLITLLVYFEKNVTKRLHNPTKKFDELELMYATLNEKNKIELKHKNKDICTKNQSFTLTVAHKVGCFKLTKPSKKVFFSLF
jgi:hypothetical protein